MRIAITGGIAEGKSTVLEMLRREGARVASADEIVQTLWRTEDFLKKVASLAGQESATKEGVRERLADDKFRRALNQISHPYVARAMSQILLGFVEVPLLIETALQASFDKVWVVTCDPAEQFNRLRGRGLSDSQAAALIATQLPSAAKIPFADVIVRTNHPLADVQRFVSAALPIELR